MKKDMEDTAPKKKFLNNKEKKKNLSRMQRKVRLTSAIDRCGNTSAPELTVCACVCARAVEEGGGEAGEGAAGGRSLGEQRQEDQTGESKNTHRFTWSTHQTAKPLLFLFLFLLSTQRF